MSLRLLLYYSLLVVFPLDPANKITSGSSDRFPLDYHSFTLRLSSNYIKLHQITMNFLFNYHEITMVSPMMSLRLPWHGMMITTEATSWCRTERAGDGWLWEAVGSKGGSNWAALMEYTYTVFTYVYIYTYYMVNCWLWIGIAKLLQVVRWLGHFSVAIFRPYLKSWRPDFIQNCWWLTSAAAFWLSHGFVIEIHQIWGRRKLST